MTQHGYPFTVRPLGAGDGGGDAITYPDLAGCMSDGDTVHEAVANGADALRCGIAAMTEAGRPIPAPRRRRDASPSLAFPRRQM